MVMFLGTLYRVFDLKRMGQRIMVSILRGDRMR